MINANVQCKACLRSIHIKIPNRPYRSIKCPECGESAVSAVYAQEIASYFLRFKNKAEAQKRQ